MSNTSAAETTGEKALAFINEQLAELLLALRQWGSHYTMKGAPVALTLNRAAATIRDFAAGGGTVNQPRTNPLPAAGGDLHFPNQMTRTEFEAKVEVVRMMAGNNQFTIEACGWLTEICHMAKVNQDLIRAAFDGVSVINRITKGTGYQGQLVTNHPWAEALSVAAWNAHSLTVCAQTTHAVRKPCAIVEGGAAADLPEGESAGYHQGFGGHGY